MMKPLIPASAYLDPQVLEQERALLFEKLWNFAGFKKDLANPNDYLATDIGGIPVTVQNFHGELRAFRNVCSHRFSQIRCERKGNGPLQCPYHHWTYNSVGIPVGIPHVERFSDLSDPVRESLRLESWQVQICGELIFVKLYDDGISLREYLGEFYERFETYSEALGTQVDRYEITIRANWKLVVQNTLESYHVPAIHYETFGKQDGGIREEELFDLYPHSWCTTVGMNIDPKSRKSQAIYASRKLKLDRYHHYFTFPTFTATTLLGIWFGIQSVHPINTEETKVVINLFLCKLQGNREKIILDVGCGSVVDVTREVWHEDRAICEKIQRGIAAMGQRQHGIFSSEEERVYNFHRAYLHYMKGED